MFAMMLRTQWQWTRPFVAGFALIAFLMPALAWRMGAAAVDHDPVLALMHGFEGLGPMLAFLALFGPFVLAAYPWTVDAEARHVYPLSLPLPWYQWVLMRWVIGALTLLIPTIALYAGARFVVALVDLPESLRSYPEPLALRFLIACLLAYAMTFALQYLAGRRAGVVALSALFAAGTLSIILWALGIGGFVDTVVQLLFEWPGPLAVYAEPWTLIDV